MSLSRETDIERVRQCPDSTTTVVRQECNVCAAILKQTFDRVQSNVSAMLTVCVE